MDNKEGDGRPPSAVRYDTIWLQFDSFAQIFITPIPRTVQTYLVPLRSMQFHTTLCLCVCVCVRCLRSKNISAVHMHRLLQPIFHIRDARVCARTLRINALYFKCCWISSSSSINEMIFILYMHSIDHLSPCTYTARQSRLLVVFIVYCLCSSLLFVHISCGEWCW